MGIFTTPDEEVNIKPLFTALMKRISDYSVNSEVYDLLVDSEQLGGSALPSVTDISPPVFTGTPLIEELEVMDEQGALNKTIQKFPHPSMRKRHVLDIDHWLTNVKKSSEPEYFCRTNNKAVEFGGSITVGQPPVESPVIKIGGPETKKSSQESNDADKKTNWDWLAVPFEDRYKEFLKKKFRPFPGLLYPENSPNQDHPHPTAYSEIVFFKIAKHALDQQGGLLAKPVQCFYIPNIKDNYQENDIINNVKFFDTQGKYGKPYVYIVTAFNIVVGTKYQYLGLESAFGDEQLLGQDEGKTQDESAVGDPLAGDYTSSDPAPLAGALGLGDEPLSGNAKDLRYKARFTVTSQPFTFLVETPYFTTEPVVVMDKPPIAPDANIVSFKDFLNEILILFNPGTGEIEDFPIIINPEDQEIFDKVSNSQKQNVINHPEKIKFKSDDLTTSYEVF